MKRDDGVNRNMPLKTHAFGKMNPRRWHVVQAFESWDIYLGPVAFARERTFDGAIAMAQQLARATTR